jgi:hypothetical protein
MKTKTVYVCLWDDGRSACGDFGEFPTYQAAEAFGKKWADDMNVTDPPEDPEHGPFYTYEVQEKSVEVEEDPEGLEPRDWDPIADGWVGKDGRP